MSGVGQRRQLLRRLLGHGVDRDRRDVTDRELTLHAVLIEIGVLLTSRERARRTPPPASPSPVEAAAKTSMRTFGTVPFQPIGRMTRSRSTPASPDRSNVTSPEASAVAPITP